tara:strand:- start:381 stop:737 length:357 start_codon:yes stop_codon:yes gene_type:complete
MKEINLISFLIGILFFGFIACKNNKTPKNIIVETVEAPFKKAQPMAMKIEGMVCALGCAASIEKNLNKTTGIKEAKVDFKAQKAILIFDPEVLTPNEVKQVVLNTGATYSVKDLQLLD